MGVENVEAVVKQSSIVDLDESSTFDLEAYYDLHHGNKQQKSGKVPPSFIMRSELEKKYAIPRSKRGI